MQTICAALSLTSCSQSFPFRSFLGEGRLRIVCSPNQRMPSLCFSLPTLLHQFQAGSSFLDLLFLLVWLPCPRFANPPFLWLDFCASSADAAWWNQAQGRFWAVSEITWLLCAVAGGWKKTFLQVGKLLHWWLHVLLFSVLVSYQQQTFSLPLYCCLLHLPGFDQPFYGERWCWS